MTTIPDPKIVREIARRILLNEINRFNPSWFAQSIGVAVRDEAGGHLGMQEYSAWFNAVHVVVSSAQVAVSWSDEQQAKPCPCGCPVVDDMCSCPTPCPCEPDCAFCMVPNPMRQPDQAHVAREQQAERNDAQMLAETVVRLKRWLEARQGKAHSVVSSTSVIAEPRDRSTAAWAIAESDVAAVVAALEARTTAAGE